VSRTGKALAGKPLPAVRAATAEHKPGEHWVKLKFEREAWVEIRDRSGRRILSQLNPAGTEKVVSGQPPLSLVVGNAAGVRVTHNDQSVDLAPYIQVDVARLTLE
jgi:cytoskeleton protein RodZ